MTCKLVRTISACALMAVFSTGALAQDAWTPAAYNGIDDNLNNDIHTLHVFNGQLYAGAGYANGVLYRSATGDPDSWSRTFSRSGNNSIDAIATTTTAGGYMYIAVSGGCCDTSLLMRSPDGTNFTPYFYSPNSTFGSLINYNAGGSQDSIYATAGNNAYIVKSAATSNDPYNSGHQWDTVLDLTSSFSAVYALCVHNGKLYAGAGDGSLWETSDGHHFHQNAAVGHGFGVSGSKSITALASFGGYIYIAIGNAMSGPHIWRSADDVNWTEVRAFGSSFDIVSSMNTLGSKLWITATDALGNFGSISYTSDGLSYTNSNTNGFGIDNLTNYSGCMAAFGNNIYWGGEHNSGSTSSSPQGAQIWRLCTATPPTVSIGPDQQVCSGSSVTLNAGPGATSYLWSDGETTQTITATLAGMYTATYTSGGCSASSSMHLTNKRSPYIPDPNVPPVVCAGTPVVISTTATANVAVPQTPVHRSTHDTINYSLGNVYDTIHVTGAPGTIAGNSLFSVTIDSLYHSYDDDLTISIYAPSGDNAVLSDGHGGASNAGYFGTEFNTTVYNTISSSDHPPFTGTYAPQTAFTALTGSPNGAWVLRISDQSYPDNGMLKGWSIRFKTDDTTMTYSWTPATGVSNPTALNPVITPPLTTTYTLTGTNSAGCSWTDNVLLNVAAVHFPQSADTVCAGSGIHLTVSGGSPNTTWTPTTNLSPATGDDVYATPTSDITYYISDTISGCYSRDSIHLVMDSPMTLSYTPAPVNICYGDTAFLTANVSGGFAPYSYNWNDGGHSFTGSNIFPVLTSGKSFTVTATDAAGCYAGGGNTFVVVGPSTDIYGNVSYSGGPVAFSTVLLYRHETYLTHFDTADVTTTDADGNYHFTSAPHHDYIIEVIPSATYTTLVPSYYGNQYLWDAATVVSHNCADNDTLDITAIEFSAMSGPGVLQGTILEGPGYGTHPGMVTAPVTPGHVRAPGEPIPGIDVKLGRNPGGQLMTTTTTDAGGHYTFTNVPLNLAGEHYTVYVDIPGLGRDSSYNVTLDASNNQFLNLDYYVDSTVVYIVDNTTTGVTAKTVTNGMSVYPNPSAGNSSIEYTIGASAKVSLDVYNVLGVKVASLLQYEQPAGTYKTELHAKERGLQAGIYFITLSVDGRKTTQRLVITD